MLFPTPLGEPDAELMTEINMGLPSRVSSGVTESPGVSCPPWQWNTGITTAK